MDKQLLNALDNLSIALEVLTDALNKKKNEAKSPTGTALQSGDFSKQIVEINQSIKGIKSDTKKILDNQNTILKLQREKKDEKFKAFEGAGKEGNKKTIKDGISIILLIAGAVLAIGFAFKLVGSVDWMSVIALSISLPLIAMAFQKVKESGITIGDAFVASGVMIVASLGIVAASYILGSIKPVGFFQLLTAAGIAVAFYFIAPAIGAMIQGLLTTTTVNFEGMSLSKQSLDPATIIQGLLLVPLVMIAASIGIVAASHILSEVKPIGLFQAFTAILIAAAFGAMAYGLGTLISGLKDINPATALAAGIVIPIVMIALSYAIVGASWWFALIRPIGLFEALTAILIAAVFVVLSYAVKPLMSGIKGVSPKDIATGTLVLLALTAAVVGASWMIGYMYPLSFGTLVDFVLASIALAVSVVVLAIAVKLVNMIGKPSDYLKGSVSIVILATAVAVSSLILSIGNYSNYPTPDWSLGVGLSLAFFGIGAVLLGTQASNPTFYLGLLVIPVVALSIVLTSAILNTGVYGNYPSPSWALGVGLSLGFFGIGAVLLGTQVFNPFFYAGLGMILVVAATIVAVSYIFEMGSYNVYPPVEWVVPTVLILGSFAALSVVLGIMSPFIAAGSIAALMIVSTIFIIDLIFSLGKYNVYPPVDWVMPTFLVLGSFASLSIFLGLMSPFIALGSITALMIVGTIFAIDLVFNLGKYNIYPSADWSSSSITLIGAFAGLAVFVSLISPLILIGSLTLIGVAATILAIDEIFKTGDWKIFPNNDWVNGSISAITKFQKLMSEQSLLGAIGQGIAGLFGASSGDSIIGIAEMILSVDRIFSMGDFTKYPTQEWITGVQISLSQFKNVLNGESFDIDGAQATVIIARSIGLVSLALSVGDYTKYPKAEWIDGTIYALSKFGTIINLLSFSGLTGGGLLSGLSGLFGVQTPLEIAISNITLLSIAFEKLGQAMNSFATAIQGLDMDKLSTIKGMTSNVILLSLMDADMLDDVLDKMEERSGVFADLLKSFEDSKQESVAAKPVKGVVSASNQKSDSQILGEKIDGMTAILADISTVVGSRGTLKTYLNSIKDKQLTGTSNTPSTTNRSDKRLKNIIKKIGSSLSGINIYLFTYTFNPKVIYQGVIAQELINTPFEDALIIDKNGFYSVDYSKIDVDFKKISKT